ncbi:hypothetical protein F5Y04DRAFT_262913 [Hypomontagnella monticulosa]|nr:hypothetical protein F5Y04DRAFT_262913 [Hypomontagnella monticulosa]
MRGHLVTQLLLAPLLATALSTRQVNSPHALINLDINTTSDDASLEATTLRLDILESTSPCGYGNVTINDQTLAQDENGSGSGSITTEDGNTITAAWSFICVHLEDEFQGQSMTFEVLSVDDSEVNDVWFVVHFQQTAPASVSFVNGTASITEASAPTETEDGVPDEEAPVTLDDELAELKSMMRQMAALEYAITSKMHHIAETYDYRGPDEFHSFTSCDSLKCIVKTMYSRAKHMAIKLSGHRGDHHFGGRLRRPHWPFHHREGGHGDRPPWFPPHHRGGPHGNHSFPHPHPPHHPPHGEPPHHPPPPPFCHCPPPPHPPPFPPGFHDGPPPDHPPPDFPYPGDDMPEERPRPTGMPHGDMGPIVHFGEDRPERPLHIPHDGGEGPPPPPPMASHPGRPPHHHPPPFGHHPHPPFHAIKALQIVATIVLLTLLISAIFTRCFRKCRGNHHSRCAERRHAHKARRQRNREAWAARRAAVSAKYSDIARWLRDSIRRRQVEDEEKEAMMRRLHRSDSEAEEEDNLSTTMEQEIAQFRAVASVVGDLVAAEEGRSHGYAGAERPKPNDPVPPSPTSAFPDYASVDEELPAYDEGSNDSRFVADGFRYTPNSSYYSPSDSSVTGSSLDEHLGRKD